MFKAAGHTILRLPAYHPDLNPIDTIWSIVKQRVAARNVTYNINDLIRLTNEEFGKITVDIWRKTVRRAVDAENRFFNSEVQMETIEIVVLPESSGSDREYEEIPCAYESDGDGYDWDFSEKTPL